MPRLRLRYLAASALILLLVPAIAACGTSSAGGTGSTSTSTSANHSNIKIGLVTDIGGLNDRGFNHLAYVGLMQAKKDFGVTVSVKESKSGDDYVPNLTAYATQGYNLVIAVGFLMQQAVGTVSGQFPNVHFAIIDGAGTDANGNDLHHANVESLVFREQEAGALVGVIAGMMEKDNLTKTHNNVLSAVGGVSIPPVNHYIAGYKWGAEQVDPSVKVLVGYSNDFSDPSKCLGVANGQIAQGADIVFQVAGGCGLGALQAAGQKGVYSIGVDTDQKTADSSVVASAVKRVDVATYDAIKAVVNGKFQGGADTFTLKNNGVGYAPGNIQLPADIVNQVKAIEQKIINGSVTVPDSL